MSIKSAELILMGFIIVSTVFLIKSLLEKDTGNILMQTGHILSFILMYFHPKALISKPSELNEHIRLHFKKSDHMMVWCGISLMLLGLFIKMDL